MLQHHTCLVAHSALLPLPFAGPAQLRFPQTIPQISATPYPNPSPNPSPSPSPNRARPSNCRLYYLYASFSFFLSFFLSTSLSWSVSRFLSLLPQTFAHPHPLWNSGVMLPSRATVSICPCAMNTLWKASTLLHMPYYYIWYPLVYCGICYVWYHPMHPVLLYCYIRYPPTYPSLLYMISSCVLRYMLYMVSSYASCITILLYTVPSYVSSITIYGTLLCIQSCLTHGNS